MVVDGDVLWGVVVYPHDNPVVLVNLEDRTGRLAVDEQHLSGEAIWSVVVPCYLEIKLFGLLPVAIGCYRGEEGLEKQREKDEVGNKGSHLGGSYQARFA